MFVLVSDYEEVMEKDYHLTELAIRQASDMDESELKIIVEPYGTEQFLSYAREAVGLITAFIPVNRILLDQMPNLKYISINAAGYSNLDLKALQERGIKECHIKEYCTREVSEHALAMLLAINNNLKPYGKDIEKGNWQYSNLPPRPTLDHLKVVIFGFGKIGRCTKNLLKALGVEVCFVDPFVTEEQGYKEGVVKLQLEEVYEYADVIINHMALTEDNYHMFDYEFFQKCSRKPIFINVGRGGCVDEEGLARALKEELLFGAGLDVLEDENPNLKECSLVDMERVILTPHAAFYSTNSLEKLHRISGENMGYMLKDSCEKAR